MGHGDDSPDAWERQLGSNRVCTDLGKPVRAALRQFLTQDLSLLECDAHERTIAATLACHLKPLFGGWDVDVEYNRQRREPKRSGPEDELVIPDVIVHRRGTPENELVIEIKKNCSPQERRETLTRLSNMCRPPLDYRCGMLIRFAVGGNPGVREVVCRLRGRGASRDAE